MADYLEAWNAAGNSHADEFLLAGFLAGNIPLLTLRADTTKINGNVEVQGDVILASGAADCSEEFDVMNKESVDQGTVMVINEDGKLEPSQKAYDRCVAGVISGAGQYRPGIVLDKQPTKDNRLPIALVGKVCCKVDAQYGEINVGDLLTTSDTAGYAMKVSDHSKALGSIIGKALRHLTNGKGIIPILIALQ